MHHPEGLHCDAARLILSINKHSSTHDEIQRVCGVVCVCRVNGTGVHAEEGALSERATPRLCTTSSSLMAETFHTVMAYTSSCPALDGLDQGISPKSPTEELGPGSGLPRLHRSRSRVSRRAEPFIIGVAGGTASGKTTVCDLIMQNLHGGPWSGPGLGAMMRPMPYKALAP